MKYSLTSCNNNYFHLHQTRKSSFWPREGLPLKHVYTFGFNEARRTEKLSIKRGKIADFTTLIYFYTYSSELYSPPKRKQSTFPQNIMVKCARIDKNVTILTYSA